MSGSGPEVMLLEGGGAGGHRTLRAAFPSFTLRLFHFSQYLLCLYEGYGDFYWAVGDCWNFSHLYKIIKKCKVAGSRCKHYSDGILINASHLKEGIIYLMRNVCII